MESSGLGTAPPRPSEQTGEDSSSGVGQPDFICKLKYRYSLPDVPGYPKLLEYPLNPTRHLDYIDTIIHKNYKFPILTEPNMGIDLDLINPDAYPKASTSRLTGIVSGTKPKLAQEDLDLLPDTVDTVIHSTQATNSVIRPVPQLKEKPPWLRKPEYLPHEAISTSKRLTEDVKPLETVTREQMIQQIEESFEAAKTIQKHPHKPHVEPVEVRPILPDFCLWGNIYTQAVFDIDPDPLTGVPQEVAERRMLHSMIRGRSIQGKQGEHIPGVALYLPAVRKRSRRTRRVVRNPEVELEPGDDAIVDITSCSENEDADDEREPRAHEYEFVRDYTYTVRANQYGPPFVFYFDANGILRYHDITTRLELHKRKAPTTPGAPPELSPQVPPLACVSRDLNEGELVKRTERMRELEDDLVGPLDVELVIEDLAALAKAAGGAGGKEEEGIATPPVAQE